MMTGEKKGSKEKEGRTCGYPMHDGKPCGRPLYDDEHCIFHSKDIEGKKKKFNDVFWKEFERQKEHEEEYDFRGFVFPGNISFEQKIFEKMADFKKAQFSEKAYFWNAQFSGEANFGEAQFSGRANFWYAEFHKKSFFRNAKFEDFNQCNMDDTSFYNVYDLLEYIAKNRKKFKRSKGIKYLHDKCKPILGEATVSRLPLLSREIRDDLYLMSFKEKHPKLFYLWWLFADCGRSIFRWALWSFFPGPDHFFSFRSIFSCYPSSIMLEKV
jgi:hypothetical protein